MKMNKYSVVILVSSLLLFVAMALVVTQGSDRDAPETGLQAVQGTVTANAPLDDETPTGADPVGPFVVSSEEEGEQTFGPFKMTRAEITEYNDWLAANGYERLFTSDGKVVNEFDPPPITSYETYSNELLEGLVDSDDYAGLVLGKRLLRAGKLEDAEPLLFEAAIDGYASAIDDLHRLYSQKSRVLKEEDGGFEEAYENLVKSYAWRNVMNLRFFPDRQIGQIHEGWVRRDFDEDLKEQLFEDALKASDEIYSELRAARRSRGLREFDTYHPETALREQQGT